MRNFAFQCPQCKAGLKLDEDYLPPNGFDYRMRKFTCTGYGCITEMYIVLTKMQLQLADSKQRHFLESGTLSGPNLTPFTNRPEV